MPSLTVWRYDAPMGADAGAVRLKNLEQQGALTVHDAITVTWLKQEKQPASASCATRRLPPQARASLLGGLIGLVVLAPAAGAAAGAAIGAVAHRLRGTGIDRTLLEEVQERPRAGYVGAHRARQRRGPRRHPPLPRPARLGADPRRAEPDAPEVLALGDPARQDSPGPKALSTWPIPGEPHLRTALLSSGHGARSAAGSVVRPT